MTFDSFQKPNPSSKDRDFLTLKGFKRLCHKLWSEGNQKRIWQLLCYKLISNNNNKNQNTWILALALQIISQVLGKSLHYESQLLHPYNEVCGLRDSFQLYYFNLNLVDKCGKCIVYTCDHPHLWKPWTLFMLLLLLSGFEIYLEYFKWEKVARNWMIIIFW